MRGFTVSVCAFLFDKLSGKLHNVARAVADEETGTDFSEVEETERKFPSDFDRNSFLGLGLKPAKRVSLNLAPGESNVRPAVYDVKDTEKRLFSPLSAKPSTYLSQFILHIAAIGDIVDGTDTTHDFNYFSVIYEWPKDVSKGRFLAPKKKDLCISVNRAR